MCKPWALILHCSSFAALQPPIFWAGFLLDFGLWFLPIKNDPFSDRSTRGWARRVDSLWIFQFILKVLSGVEVVALCRPLNLGQSYLHGPQTLSCWNRFQTLSSCEGELLILQYARHSRQLCVPTLWQHFGEDPHMDVMGGCPNTFDYILLFFFFICITSCSYFCLVVSES